MHRPRRVRFDRYLQLGAMIAMPAFVRAEPAFPNADFEQGTFAHWEVHESAYLRGGVTGGYDTQSISHPALLGDFSAGTRPGISLVQRYSGKKPEGGPLRLVSEPFPASRAFLTFFFFGDLGRKGTRVGVDTDGDLQPDILLTAAAARAIQAGCSEVPRHQMSPTTPYRYALDVSAHKDKPIRFVMEIAEGEATVDELRLEDQPPAWVSLAGVDESDGRASIRLLLDNPYAVPAQADLQVRVVDAWGGALADERIRVELPPKSRGLEKRVSYALNVSPHDRFEIASRDPSGALRQLLRHRHHRQSGQVGRPFTRIEDGWTLTVSTNRTIELRGEDAAWKPESPMRPLYGYGYRFWPRFKDDAQVWFRRDLNVPEGFDRERLVLRLDGGGAGLATVFVNGREVGTRNLFQHTFEEFDLTAHVSKEGPNTLILRLRNPEVYLRGDDGQALEPFWDYHRPPYGLLGVLRLESRPAVQVDRVFVDSFFRERRLAVRTRVTNASGQPRDVALRHRVYDRDGTLRLEFAAVAERIAAGATREIALSADWPDPVLWTPDDPKLLRLETELREANSGETVQTRFGFRELWSEGKTLYCNDIPLRLFEGTMTPPEELEGVRRWWGQNSQRSTFMGYEAALAADEAGTITKVVNEDIYPPKKPIEPRYWDAYANWQMQRAEYYYNHPSVYAWMVGNEKGGHGYLRHANLRDDFIPRYMELCKRLQAFDPQRPAGLHGDFDVFGVSRIWNAHYPYEYGYAYDHPHDAYILTHRKGLNVWGPHPEYQGDKPFVLGESFSGGNMGPDWLAPIVGARAYEGSGFLEGWEDWYRMRSRAYRLDGMLGYEPFEPFAWIANFWPVDVFPLEYDTRFYAGAKVERRLQVFNDTASVLDGTLHWSFGDAASGRVPIHLKAGESRVVPVTLDMPAVTERTALTFQARLERNDQPMFPRWGAWAGTYHVIPRASVKRPAAALGLSDGQLDMLRFFDIAPAAVDNPAALPKGGLLIAAVESAQRPEWAAPLAAWVAEGGTALILADGAAGMAAPFEIAVSAQLNTHGHLAAPQSPWLDGLEAGDLVFWGREDFRIARGSMVKPGVQPCRVLVETADNSGLRLTPYLEFPHGLGRYLFSTLLLEEKYREAPVAGLLLANAVRGAVPAAAPGRLATLLSDDLTAFLEERRLVFDDLARQDAVDLRAYDLVWIDAGIAELDIAALTAYVEGGGRLVLSRLDPSVLEAFRPLVGEGVQLTRAPDDLAYGGELRILRRDALLQGLSHYDFWWKRGTYSRGGSGMRITTPPAEFVLDVPETVDAIRHTAPLALAEVTRGRGRLLFDQVRWEEALNQENRSPHALLGLLANLGVQAQPDTTGASGATRLIPLAIPVNHVPDGKRLPGAEGRIALLQKGARMLGGVAFTLGESLLLLGGKDGREDLPASAALTVPAGLRAEALFFLHATADGYIDYDEHKPVIEYRVALEEDGQARTETVAVRYGHGVDHYLGAHETVTEAGQVAFSGRDGLSAYLLTWNNPRPRAIVRGIEVVAMDPKIMPLVLAVSARVAPEREDAAAVARRTEGPWSVRAKRFSLLTQGGRTWAALGYFDGTPIEGGFPKEPMGAFLQVYPPEKGIDLKASYTGKSGAKIEWRPFRENFPEDAAARAAFQYGYSVKVEGSGILDFIEGEPDKVNWAAYFYTRVFSPVAQKAIIAFGSDDMGRVWVNGVNVHSAWIQRGTSLGDDLIVVDLKKGRNDVLIKIVNMFADGAFAFDIKPYSEELIAAWKVKKAALADAPTLPLVYDAYVEDAPAADGGDTAVSNAGHLDAAGEVWVLDGVSQAPGAVRRRGDVIRVERFRDVSASLSAALPPLKGRATFARGTFSLSFRVPEGGASSYLCLAACNAGGANDGDVWIGLLDGLPSAEFGGQAGATGRPYATLRVHIEQAGKNYQPWNLPLPQGLAEGVWHKLKMTWGDAPEAPGVRVYLDGARLHEEPDYRGPVFFGGGAMALAVGRPDGGGVVEIKAFELLDRVEP